MENEHWVLIDGDEGGECWVNTETGETEYVVDEFPEGYFDDQ